MVINNDAESVVVLVADDNASKDHHSVLTNGFSLICPRCPETLTSIEELKTHLKDAHKVKEPDLASILLGQEENNTIKGEKSAGSSAVQVVSGLPRVSACVRTCVYLRAYLVVREEH